MNQYTRWMPLLIVGSAAFFGIGFAFGVTNGHKYNAEIGRLRQRIDLGEISIDISDREIETRNRALLKLRRRLAECEAGKTEVKP